MSAREIKALAGFIAFLRPSFPDFVPQGPRYSNMAALVADVTLQSAVNYQYVVKPRCERILKLFPHAETIEDVLELISAIDVRDVLCWRGPSKCARFVTLTEYFSDSGITDIFSLGRWSEREGSKKEFLAIKGFGAKSFDYLRILCGKQSIAIDRHMIQLLRWAGIRNYRRPYAEAHEIFLKACDFLGEDRAKVDYGLWVLASSCR